MLRVENITHNHLLVDNGRIARNPWTRLNGLIGVRALVEGDGLLITHCKGVHCMFMSIQIDVAMKPCAIGRIRPSSHYVLEAPVGTIARTGTAVGDQFSVIRKK